MHTLQCCAIIDKSTVLIRDSYSKGVHITATPLDDNIKTGLWHVQCELHSS
jgi:hypothetical protein